MKEFSYAREKETNFLLFSFVVALTIAQALLLGDRSKLAVLFHAELKVGKSNEDFDLNLSGNSGISQDYYVKQLGQ